MNTKSLRLALAALLVGASSLGAFASGAKPDAFKPRHGTSDVCATWLSNNGRWALATIQGDQDVDNPQGAGGVLIDTSTKQTITIKPGNNGIGEVNDVSDDGNIVVGTVDGKPAYWNREKDLWTKLALPRGYDFGVLLYVTPDGRRAIGVAAATEDVTKSTVILYDLATADDPANRRVNLTNLPTTGLNGKTYGQNVPHGLSADGKYFVGMIAESMMMDEQQSVMWAYVYDIENNTYKPIGWTLEGDKMTPLHPYSNFIDFVVTSPSGEWVTGGLRIAQPITGSMFNKDYMVVFRYNTLTDEYQVFDNGEAEEDHAAHAIDDAGRIYSCAPWDNPYSTAEVRLGNYFYTYEQIFSQAYRYSLTSQLGEAGVPSGKAICVSGDGLVQAMVNGDNEGYLLRLSEPLTIGAEQVDLLGTYAADPANNSVMSRLRTLTLNFDRAIEFVGDYSQIVVLKGDEQVGKALSSTQVLTSNNRALSIGIRPIDMEEGVTYTVLIPAGTVCIKGDPSLTNREIRLTYKGRGNSQLTCTRIYPADGATISRLDNMNNPVLLTFDAEVALNPEKTVLLYEDDYNTPKATLVAQASGNLVYIFPTNTQYLFAGSTYRVEIPEGLVTDLSGAGANAAMTLNFEGSYIREVNSDDTTIFSADGSVDAFLQFIVFDGDENEPAQIPASWEFTAATAWWGVLGSESSQDLSFASHSMYTPAGKSDDWMMTPQLYIPDNQVYLTFDAQSYLKNKKDVLKVYVYVSDEGINTLNADLVKKIREQGDIIFDQQLNPGATEEGLEGDWTNYKIKLNEYAGKSIYIAFVNENENQSAIFLDNIMVKRDMAFTMAFRHNPTVVAKTSQKIEGRLTFTSETQTFHKMTLRLLDSNSEEIGFIEAPEGDYKLGDTFDFSFDTELPLTVGFSNPFTIQVDLDGKVSSLSEAIADMLFEPVKRVVIEEYSGATCANCPLGILAIENLEKLYPGRILPVVLRCYGGDPQGLAVQGYASYLGLQAAPTGYINREPQVYNPMLSANGTYLYSGAGLVDDMGQEPRVWADIVAEQMNQVAEADIELDMDYDTKFNEVTIPVKVRFALNSTGRSLRLFAVFVEDDVESIQQNGFASLTNNPELLPWSQPGQYAQAYVTYTFDDIARGTIGETYSGTGGLLPADIVAGETYTANLNAEVPAALTRVDKGKVVVMLIDGNTQLVLNSNVIAIGNDDALDSVLASEVNITAIGNTVCVNAPGEVAVNVYSLDSRLIGAARGNSTVNVALPGYHGVAIVEAVTADGRTVSKLVIR